MYDTGFVAVVTDAGWPIGSIGDYFGLPTVGQVSPGKRVTNRTNRPTSNIQYNV